MKTHNWATFTLKGECRGWFYCPPVSVFSLGNCEDTVIVTHRVNDGGIGMGDWLSFDSFQIKNKTIFFQSKVITSNKIDR